jgi:hypothetical protein
MIMTDEHAAKGGHPGFPVAANDPAEVVEEKRDVEGVTGKDAGRGR